MLLTGPGAGIPPIPSKYPQLPVAAEDGSCVHHHQHHQGRSPTACREVSTVRLTKLYEHTHTYTYCFKKKNGPIKFLIKSEVFD